MNTNDPLPSAEELEALRRFDSCTVSNAIETFASRLRNEGFTGGAVRCLFPELPPMVGYAATVKIRGSAPATAGGPYKDRTDWWNYVLSIPSPRVVVVEDVGSHVGLGSLLGTVHVNILRALGCAGAVTNGAVRDLPQARDLGFPLFAAHPSVSHAYVHVVEFGSPVAIDGLKIGSGDLLHADLHGIQTVPLEIAAQIPAAAARITAREQSIIALCKSPDFSLEKLRDAVKDGKI